jgi:hypothetical protein
MLNLLIFLFRVNNLRPVLNSASTYLRCCNLCYDEDFIRPEGDDDELAVLSPTIMCLAALKRIRQRSCLKPRGVLEGRLWMDANRLIINVEKSSIILFS